MNSAYNWSFLLAGWGEHWLPLLISICGIAWAYSQRSRSSSDCGLAYSTGFSFSWVAIILWAFQANQFIYETSEYPHLMANAGALLMTSQYIIGSFFVLFFLIALELIRSLIEKREVAHSRARTIRHVYMLILLFVILQVFMNWCLMDLFGRGLAIADPWPPIDP